MIYNLRTDFHHLFENEKIGIGTFKISQIIQEISHTFVKLHSFCKKLAK